MPIKIMIMKIKKILHGKRVGKRGRVILLMAMDSFLIVLSVAIVFMILRLFTTHSKKTTEKNQTLIYLGMQI